MAYPTLQGIMALRQPTGLETLAGALTSGYDAYQQAAGRREEQEATQAQAASEAQAANFLRQAVASQDPAESEQFVMQAFQASPEIVGKFFDIQKTRAGGERLGLEREKLDMRQAELDARNLERLLKEETNELKRKELKNKIKMQNQKIDQAKRQTQKEAESYNRDIDSSINLVDRMLQSPGLERAVGIGSVAPTLPGGQSADFEALHEQLTGRQFLSSVQQMTGMGSLSDAEGKKIASAAEALSLSMSPEAYRDALQRIREGLATRKAPGSYNNDEPAQEGAEDSNIVEWGSL